MAGFSDSCPKCGASITAPAIPAEETPDIVPPVLEPPAAPTPPPAVVEVAVPKHTSLLPPPELIQAGGPVITSRRKILHPDATLPLVQPSLTRPKDAELFPHTTPIAEVIPPVSEELRPASIRTPEAATESGTSIPHLAPMTALVPQPPAEEEPLETTTTPPGMGEMLAEHSSSTTLLQNQDSRPWLHGPFLTTAGPKKRLPGFLSNRYIIAILSFLLVDLFIFFIFRDQITGFFKEEDKAVPAPQASPPPPPAPSISKAAAPISIPVASPKAEDSIPVQKPDEPKPLAPLPMEPAASAGTVQFTPVPVVAEAPKAVAIPPVRLTSVPAAAQSAFDVLRRFLEVPTWSERANYVKNPVVVKPLMEKYASTSGDGPIVVSSINFLERYTKDKDSYCTFEVSGGFLPHPVLAIVEQPANGPAQVDWESFVEFKDDQLLKFLESNGAPNQKFRVTMQRIHYFDKDVPNLESKDSFGVRQPNAPYEGHVFIEKNSALGVQLANQLPWGKDLLVIAELTWKTNGKDHWVELQAINSYGWRY
ncbi:MAG: hypothetical protein RL693_2151 [Verrucomicrobiota bacterium]|jgi:hypothetical protein